MDSLHKDLHMEMSLMGNLKLGNKLLSTQENVSCLSKNLFLAVQKHPKGYFSVSFGHALITSLLYFGASYLLMHVHTLLTKSIGVNSSQTNLHAPERPFI